MVDWTIISRSIVQRVEVCLHTALRRPRRKRVSRWPEITAIMTTGLSCERMGLFQMDDSKRLSFEYLFLLSNYLWLFQVVKD